jgi:hypothetical protein
LGGAAILTAGVAAGYAGGAPITAHASTLQTIAGQCHSLNPQTTLNALTATNDDARPWDMVGSVTVNGGFTAPDGGAELQIVIETCATAAPSFPNTATGDVGAQWQACYYTDQANPLNSAPNGIQVGTAADGNPLYDGPYEASQGWRYCAWASINAGVSNDWGVAYYDQIGQYTFLDRANLVANNLSTKTVSDASFGIDGNGKFAVTIYAPYNWTSTAQAAAPSGSIVNVTTSSPTIVPGHSVNDMVASAEAAQNVGLPSNTCTPVVVNCFQGLAGLLTTVSYAPGFENCSTPVIGCTKTAGSGYDIGLSPIGFPLGAVEVPVNPLAPCLGTAGTCIASQHTTGVPPSSYTFDYGRLFPGPVAPSGALDSTGVPYTATGQYQDYPGDTFTA